MKPTKLCVSFWEICFANLPEGAFRRHRVSATAAKRFIDQARRQDALICLSEHDLIAPRNEHERKRHDEFRGVLAKHFKIDLSFEDFLLRNKDEDESFATIFPLRLITIDKEHRLLVITCSYHLGSRSKGKNLLDRFKLDPDTMEFHLVELLKKKPRKKRRST
jgi:hypothetical protein